MGNYRFKLSELILNPNAWFHKFRVMGKSRRKHHQEQSQQNNTLFPSHVKKQHSLSPTTTAPTPSRRSCKLASPDTPRKSAVYRLRRRPALSSSTPKHVSSSSAACCPKNPQFDFLTTSGDSTATGTESFSPEFRSDQILITNEPLERSKLTKDSSFTQEFQLRPITTKPANKPTTVRSSAAGVRLRMRSPRISGRKSQSGGGGRRKGWSRAVVKASVDPRKDFKESMEEMIAENEIRGSKDLEELLACYLCLNAQEYHHIIINVFKQLWLDLNSN